MAEVRVWCEDGVWKARRYMGVNAATGKARRPKVVLRGATCEEEARAMAEEWSATLDHLSLSQALAWYVRQVDDFGSYRATSGSRANTSDAYAGDMRRVLQVMDDVPVESVKAADVVRANERMRRRLNLAPSTVARADSFLSGAFSWLMDMGIVSDNPMAGVRVPRQARAQARPLPDAAVLAIDAEADAALSSGGRTRTDVRRLACATAAWLALRTGLRVGEVCALRTCDLRASVGDLQVSGTVVERGGVRRQGMPKSASGRRNVAIGPEVVERLRDVMRVEQTLVGELGGDDPLLTWTGGFMRPSAVSRWLSSSRERLGLPRWARFHTLRHTHVSHLIAAGVDIMVIKERLGHQDVATTLRNYGHMMPGRDRVAADVTSAGLGVWPASGPAQNCAELHNSQQGSSATVL